jgi:hypothetical protein
MLTTPAPHTPLPPAPTVTRHIDAPIDTVFSLLADVHSWPRWGPFTDTGTPGHIDQAEVPHPIRLGRRQLHVALSSPDAPYWIRYRLAGGSALAQHTADVTLSPIDDGAPTSTGAPPRPDTCPAPAAAAPRRSRRPWQGWPPGSHPPPRTRPPPAPSGPTPATTWQPHPCAA